MSSADHLESNDDVTLDALGIKFGTDKSSLDHDYLRFYERYFAGIRHEKIKFLEIGVFRGASLAVWEAYFPEGTIIGADIDVSTVQFARARVLVELLDQSNLEHLVRLGVKHGPFDVIIEDGSHQWEHQITTLKTLFPFVKDGGVYIVEDLQTNFGTMEADYRGVSSISCVEYLKQLVDLRVGDDQVDIAKIEDPFLRTYGRTMNAITFYRRACLIEKGRQPVAEDRGQPFIAIDADRTMILPVLGAHIGMRGDQSSFGGWVRSFVDSQHIQGFSILPPAFTPIELAYRARLATGDWTEWAAAGAYVGTQNLAQSLTGFAVRLGNENHDAYTVHTVGQFAGLPGLVTADNGADCAPADPAPLLGMQVFLRTI